MRVWDGPEQLPGEMEVFCRMSHPVTVKSLLVVPANRFFPKTFSVVHSLLSKYI
jgi:hypothetical protein